MPLSLIHLKDILFTHVSHLENDQASLTRLSSIKKGLKRAFYALLRTCSQTAFKQGMKTQIISGWTVAGEAQSCEQSHSRAIMECRT